MSSKDSRPTTELTWGETGYAQRQGNERRSYKAAVSPSRPNCKAPLTDTNSDYSFLVEFS
ncbi:MAG: hypothetical protein H0T08_03210 [Acidobacteria bacterium]|nr:hypothetical protein [Acidobacteriota bacterium]